MAYPTKTPRTRLQRPPANGSLTALDGYKAASILIERMLNNAEKKKPLRLRPVKQKSADYRQGMYDALLAAHCWMVLGEYPNHNREQITKVLNSVKRSIRPTSR